MGSLLDRVDRAEFDEELPDAFEEEFLDELEDDLPSEAFGKPGVGKKLSNLKPTASPLSPAMKRRVATELQLYLELLVGVAEMACEPCAEVAAQHVKKVAQRGANIMARYPDLAQKFIGSSAIADLLGLAAALRPIAKQCVGHHVTHSIVYGEEGVDDGQPDYSNYGPYRPQ